MDSSIPVVWGKKEEKDQQKAEKHKLNEGGKAAFERCKRKCECICRPLKKGFKLLKSRGRKIDYIL